jgi:hypothetical protein
MAEIQTTVRAISTAGGVGLLSNLASAQIGWIAGTNVLHFDSPQYQDRRAEADAE